MISIRVLILGGMSLLAAARASLATDRVVFLDLLLRNPLSTSRMLTVPTKNRSPSPVP